MPATLPVTATLPRRLHRKSLKGLMREARISAF